MHNNYLLSKDFLFLSFDFQPSQIKNQINNQNIATTTKTGQKAIIALITLPIRVNIGVEILLYIAESDQVINDQSIDEIILSCISLC